MVAKLKPVNFRDFSSSHLDGLECEFGGLNRLKTGPKTSCRAGTCSSLCKCPFFDYLELKYVSPFPVSEIYVTSFSSISYSNFKL